jgi:hypothetical protein
VRIKPFQIENYFAKYEFSAKYVLASSDVESQTIRDVLDLEPGAHEEFLKQWCEYTEVSGAPQLREAVAGIYTGIKSDDVVVTHSPPKAGGIPASRISFSVSCEIRRALQRARLQ